MKPICCGDRHDAEILHAAADQIPSLNVVNPIWLRTPAAPYVASMIDSQPIDLSLLYKAYQRLRDSHEQVIVEGVGGWRVPITRDFAVNDLAAELKLPVVVVVSNRLGALNHCLLTVESIRASNVNCAGVILNDAECAPGEGDVAARTNSAVLEELLQVPILAKIQHGGEELHDVRSR
jgi:dethiobiotin synthetase